MFGWRRDRARLVMGWDLKVFQSCRGYLAGSGSTHSSSRGLGARGANIMTVYW